MEAHESMKKCGSKLAICMYKWLFGDLGSGRLLLQIPKLSKQFKMYLH